MPWNTKHIINKAADFRNELFGRSPAFINGKGAGVHGEGCVERGGCPGGLSPVG